MRLRCPDSSPGKGQTGIASAQERKTDALTHLHGCNMSRGNVEGGHPTGCTTTHVTCRGLESPTCPQVTVTHAWAQRLRGSLSQPEHSHTMTQACFWSLITWLKPRVNKVPTLRRRLRRLVSLPPHKGGIGQARKMPQLAWVSPRGPTSVTSRFNLSIL